MKRTITLLVLVMFLAIGCGGTQDEAVSKDINMPKSSSDLVGENYRDVEKILTGAGFTNVSLEVMDDLITGWLTKDGAVERVSVNGYTSFSTSDKYLPDADIVITYHTFQGNKPAITESEQALVPDKDRNGYNSGTNTSIAVGGISFSVPEYYVSSDTQGIEHASNHFYVDNEDGASLLIYLYDGIFSDKDWENRKDYIDSSLLDSVEYILKNKEDKTIASMSGRMLELAGKDATVKTAYVYNKYKGGVVALVLIQDEGNEYNYFPDFDKIIENASLVSTTPSSEVLRGMQYQDVVDWFKSEGFTSISRKPIEDLVLGVVTEDGTVESVTVGGKSKYDGLEGFDKDAKVVISYHTYASGQNASSESSNSNKEKSQEITSGKTGNESNKTDEYEFKRFIGKPVSEIFSIVAEKGYTANYTAQNTGDDFTEWMRDDPSFGEEIIIQEIKNVNTDSKTLEVVFLGKVLIQEAEEKKTNQEILESKLDPSVAWGTLWTYCEEHFVYGFKSHQITQTLAERAEDENTWFLKAGCEYKDASGTWVEAVVEARVTGTDDNPEITYFYVYD